MSQTIKASKRKNIIMFYIWKALTPCNKGIIDLNVQSSEFLWLVHGYRFVLVLNLDFQGILERKMEVGNEKERVKRQIIVLKAEEKEKTVSEEVWTRSQPTDNDWLELVDSGFSKPQCLI